MKALEFFDKINCYFAHIFFQYHIRLDKNLAIKMSSLKLVIRCLRDWQLFLHG